MSVASCAEIGFDDLGVGLHLRRRSLCDLLAMVQHRDGIAQTHDQFDIVFDQQNRAAIVSYAVYQFA